MKTLSILLFPNIMASSVSLPIEMFNAADNIQRGQDRRHQAIKINLVGQTLEPVTTSGGLKLCPSCNLEDNKEEIANSDWIIIPALWRNPLTTLKRNNWLTQWLKQQNFALNTQICAVGTGSSFLAESDILNEKSATTHWFYYDLMNNKYPNVDWKRQHLITQSGNIFCAGSINSIADLCIHFIQSSYSTAISKRVESQFSPEIRRDYDDYLFDDSLNTRHHDELIASAQNAISGQFSEEINFADFAENLQISNRSFQRRFKAASNLSPLQYQQNVRISNAKQLLQQSNLSIQEVAIAVGYTDASHFSRLFKKHCQQTPKNFRNAVRGKLFNALE
ncbi:MAG: helix-turn-helix domain-containing protein [Pseudomonadales bacterium]|nr:helix-turn-helix domain-containing protein [Pseudomonadales bacterium]